MQYINGVNDILIGDPPRLTSGLLERVLARLGLNREPEPTLEGLRDLYGAWCQKVPFDNVRKRIHLSSGNRGALPGTTATDFLETWLKWGTGGTCWAGAGALHAVLASLGFDARRGIGTMLVAPDLPPNHATVAVNFGHELYLVDSGMLHGEPLPLEPECATQIAHAAWGLRCAMSDGRWHIHWRPLHRLDGFECRLERFGASGVEYDQFHAQTRGWSPFNYQVYARINRGQRVVGAAFGQAVSIEGDGRATQQPVPAEERTRVLVEQIGISEEIVARLPEDVPTPPPPFSRTAQTRLVAA